MTVQNKRFSTILLSISFIYLLFLVAIQLSAEANISIVEYLSIAAILFGIGVGVEMIFRKVKNRNQRILFFVAGFIILLLIWAELAVGIFGTPFAGS